MSKGIIVARYRCCKRGCPHRLSRHASQTGPADFSSEFCAYGDTERELSQQFMEGPDSNCPAGIWADRISIKQDGHAVWRTWDEETEQDCGPADDPDAWQQWNEQQNRQRRRQRDKPGGKEAVRQIGQNADIDADAETALAVLVAAGTVPGWMADEISNELGTGT